MSEEISIALRRPFHPSRVHWRVGKTAKRDGKERGMALAYIDARDVMQRFDEVCGVDGWQVEYTHQFDKTLICRIGVKFGDEWVWKSDGAGETSYEGEKGKVSDAFKRAAVHFGVGRYLYTLGVSWVDLDTNKQIRTPPELPAVATPEGFDERVKRGHMDCVREHFHSIATIKLAIEHGNLSTAVEAWSEIPKKDQESLWLATTKGGVFTTAERAAIKSNEWLAIQRSQCSEEAA